MEYLVLSSVASYIPVKMTAKLSRAALIGTAMLWSPAAVGEAVCSCQAVLKFNWRIAISYRKQNFSVALGGAKPRPL